MRHHYLNPENTFQRLLGEYRQYGSIVVAVDFDNTLYDYHNAGLDCEEVIELVQNLKSIGCCIVLWTASEEVDFIKKYCAERRIPFDLLNENPSFFKSESRKIYYNELLDDRAGFAESFERLSRLYQIVA
jgi:hydroxymethylpyrimidine pyrophosphatase-like HAD family hydrolase